MSSHNTTGAGHRQAIEHLAQQMRQHILGQDALIDTLILALLSDGHVLLEGLPGTAKTRTIRTLAQLLGVSLGRIQFTPDLLPADITGTEVYRTRANSEELVFQPGPLFHELVLADEINRAPAKVQSALLEAMAERQVTVAGQSHDLPALFLVMATQNPLEHEGTYPLPEAQLDRFTLKALMPYPDAAAERAMLTLAQQEETTDDAITACVQPEQILAAREDIAAMTVSPAIDQYIVDLVVATRTPASDAGQHLSVGASPRASIALHRLSRAHAWRRGKPYVDPDDVRAVAHPVLRHRLSLHYEAIADGVTPDTVVDLLLGTVAVG